MIRIKAGQRKNQRKSFTAQRREENTSNSNSLRLGVSAFFSCPNLVSFYAFHCYIYWSKFVMGMATYMKGEAASADFRIPG